MHDRLALDQARPCNPSACHILREDLVARGLVADFGQAGEVSNDMAINSLMSAVHLLQLMHPKGTSVLQFVAGP